MLEKCIKKVLIFSPHFPPDIEDEYKNKGKDLLLKSLELYTEGNKREAYFVYKNALLFDPSNRKVSVVRGISVEILRQLETFQSEEDGKIENCEMGEEEEPNYAELMLEGYEGVRKKVFVEGVSDPDEYDEYYNQYYERDLGDEYDEYLEKLEDE